MSAPRILICGGGTGGHVFPGLAVADAMRALADVDVVFAGTPRGLEKSVIPARGYPLELLNVEPMKGGGARRAVRGALVAARETARAIAVVRRVSPRAVLSVGGYAAGPIAIAAALLGIPVSVLEPNSIVGLTNRMLGPFARRAYVAWPETSGFRASTTRLFGVPLRTGFEPTPYVVRDVKRLLVMGGSQGAAPLNDRLPRALAGHLRDIPGLEVIHQTGKDRDTRVRETYAREGFTRVTVTPFLDEVAREIARADLILARSGAVTVAEIAAIGRAAILIPFAGAADDHQTKNAMSLAGVGGAVCLPQAEADEARIGREISRLLADSSLRVRMADAARTHGKPHAAANVAKDLLELAKIEPFRTPMVNPPKQKTNGTSPSRRDNRLAEVS